MTEEQLKRAQILRFDIDSINDDLNTLRDAKAVTTTTGTYFFTLPSKKSVPTDRKTMDAIIDLIERYYKSTLAALEKEFEEL